MSSFQGDFIKRNNKIIFKVKDIDVSILNSIRRVILAEIDNVAFENKPYNTGDKQKIKILELYSSSTINPEEKIKKVTSLFVKTKGDVSSLKLVDHYTKKAIESINQLNISENKKNDFIKFSNDLMKRDL